MYRKRFPARFLPMLLVVVAASPFALLHAEQLFQQQLEVRLDAHSNGVVGIAVDDGTLLVGDSWKGAVTEYQLDGTGNWQKTSSMDVVATRYDWFAQLLNLSGNTAVVALEDTPEEVAKSIAVFNRGLSGWSLEQIIETDYRYGHSALNPAGNELIVVEDEHRSDPTHIHLYARGGDGWRLNQSLPFQGEYRQGPPYGDSTEIKCFSETEFIVGGHAYRRVNKVWQLHRSLIRARL